ERRCAVSSASESRLLTEAVPDCWPNCEVMARLMSLCAPFEVALLRAKRRLTQSPPDTWTMQPSAREAARQRSVMALTSCDVSSMSDVSAFGVEDRHAAKPRRNRAVRDGGRLHRLAFAAPEGAA